MKESRSRLPFVVAAPPRVSASKESPPASRKVTDPTVYIASAFSGSPLIVTDVMRSP